MINILIVDDHAIVRRGLKQIIADEPEMTVAGEAQNAAEALQLVGARDWDAVVLDITMPDRNGLDVLQEIKSLKPDLPCLMLSMHPEDQFARRALRLGASGYLTKESAPEELVKALKTIIAGDRYVSAALAESLAFPEGRPNRPRIEDLSPREYQILKLIASGRTVGEIGELLAISVKTVSTHRVRMLEKMRMKNNAELTHYALQHGLVNPTSLTGAPEAT